MPAGSSSSTRFSARSVHGSPLENASAPSTSERADADADADAVVLWDGPGVASDGQPYENSYAWFMTLTDGLVIDGLLRQHLLQPALGPRATLSSRRSRCRAARVLHPTEHARVDASTTGDTAMRPVWEPPHLRWRRPQEADVTITRWLASALEMPGVEADPGRDRASVQDLPGVVPPSDMRRARAARDRIVNTAFIPRPSRVRP
jgi:hypothetical protein